MSLPSTTSGNPPGVPALDGVEERLGWPSIARRCDRLLLGELNRRIRRAGHLAEIDKVARGLDHGDGVGHAYGLGLRHRRLGCLHRLLVAYWHAEGGAGGGPGCAPVGGMGNCCACAPGAQSITRQNITAAVLAGIARSP